MEQISSNTNLNQDYLKIDKITNKRGEETTELKEHEGNFIIKQYSGHDTDNFVIKKYDGKRISFSFFKLNGIQFIYINGEHIFDYKKFISIQQISKIENEQNSNSIKVKNSFVGDFIIYNCDPETFKKALDVMNTYMKNHKNYIDSFLYYIFN